MNITINYEELEALRRKVNEYNTVRDLIMCAVEDAEEKGRPVSTDFLRYLCEAPEQNRQSGY